MAQVEVIAKGDFGYHPASGKHLNEGERYTIDEEAFSKELFEPVTDEPEGAADRSPQLATEEGGGN